MRRGQEPPCDSTVAPEERTTGIQIFIWASQKRSSSAPVVPRGSTPTSTKRPLVTGEATAARAACSSRATTAAGVPAVAKTACQL